MTRSSEWEIRSYQMELRKQKNRTMSGLVATYGRIYDLVDFEERLSPGVFRKSITESARALPLLFETHDHRSIPVGKAVEWEDTEENLIGHWQYDTRAEAVEAARLADEGYLTGLSVGFVPINTRWDHSGEKPLADRVEARMVETSMTGVPAYPDAGVLALRSLGCPEDPRTRIVPTPRLLEAKALLASLRQ